MVSILMVLAFCSDGQDRRLCLAVGVGRHVGVAFGRVEINLELHMFELRSRCMLTSRWHLGSQESHDDFKPKRKSAPADLDDAVKMIEEQVVGS